MPSHRLRPRNDLLRRESGNAQGKFPMNSVDLIYINPPFNSNRNYEVFWGDIQEKRAFADRFGDAQAQGRIWRTF
jgi:tRNA1(Val) A37 N6-methylase TrmN6